MITIIDDDIFEGEESFRLSIRIPAGFENVTTIISIQDNEGELDKRSFIVSA